jgi:prefoldin beta subunit
MELYKEYEYEIGEIKKLQKELGKTSDSVQQYLQKQHENTMVKQELEFLNKDDNVYKLVGPVLIKEELVEAKLNVDKRLDFIKKEM